MEEPLMNVIVVVLPYNSLLCTDAVHIYLGFALVTLSHDDRRFCYYNDLAIRARLCIILFIQGKLGIPGISTL